MSIDPEFAEMMTDVISVAPVASKDGYGKRTPGSAIEIRCRLMYEARRTTNGDGVEVVESGRAICFGSYPQVQTDWLLTLPDGTTPGIISVDGVADIEGGTDSHTVIGFG